MNLDDFKYVLTIAETGSYRAAAERLFITQPSISQRVKYVEKEYGITIFKRDHQGAVLTSEGREFICYASKILQNDAELREKITHSPKEETRIRFGMSWNASAIIFQDLLPELIRRYPGVRFEFAEMPSINQQDALLSNTIDVGLCYLPIVSDELSYRILLDDAVVIVPARGGKLASVLSCEYSPHAMIEPKYLNNEILTLGLPGSYLERYMKSVMGAEGIDPIMRHRLRDLSLMYSIADKGIATAVMFQSFFIRKGNALPYYFLDSGVNNHMPVALAWRKGDKFSDVADDFVRTIKAQIIN